ncbi:MAG: ATPase [Microcystaceae cyanobacterium]
MDIQDVLKWTDQQILAKTGQHLDSLQKSILEGVWEHQDYEEIADKNERSYDHIKKEAWKLWKLLSDVLEEDIKKNNVRSILENKASSTIYNFVNSPQINSNNISHNNVNICRDNPPSSDNDFNPSSNNNNNQFPIIDLSQAPELSCNYGRDLELSTLKEWIANQTRLITIYGLSGIGKTALTLKLIEEIKTEFDYIIYRSLDHTPQLIDLKDDLKQFFAQSQPSPLPDIISYLKSYRCLIIVDDLQTLFKTDELAGQYLKGSKNYSKFFQQIVINSHQSCLILLSWEQPREFTTLKSDKIKTLYLQGLNPQAEEILQEYDLKNQEKWSELMTLYQSHPSWLNIIASTITELFDEDISLFLEQMQDEIYLGDIECLIESHLQRLSETENKVIHWLAHQTEAIETFSKGTNLDLSSSQFWSAIQSLMRRCLVEKIQLENRYYFQVNPIFTAFILLKNTKSKKG